MKAACGRKLTQSTAHHLLHRPGHASGHLWRCRKVTRHLALSGSQEGPQQQPAQQPEHTAAAAAAAAAAEGEQLAPEGTQTPAPATVADAETSSVHEQRGLSGEEAVSGASTTVLYLAMGGGLAAAGLLVSVYAAPLAASCLTLGSLPLQQAAVLVGCGGAALLRAASLAAFLAEGSAMGQLGTWRFQRVNLGLAAAAAAAALLQPLSWGCASPVVLLVLLVAAAAAAAACVNTFLQHWRQGGVQFASAIGSGDWGADIQAAWVYLLRDATTLAGSVMLLLGVLGAAGGLAALASSSSAGGGLPWAAAKGLVEPGLQYMRKLLGVGLLLTAVQCWALSECAGAARRLTPETAVKLALLMQSEAEQLRSGELAAPAHASPRWFDLLHVGFFAAAVVQGLWLAQAGVVAAGPGLASMLDVNAADPVWPVLYWSVMGSAVYLVSVVAALDYTDVWAWVLGVASYLSGWVSWVAAILYVDWTWLTDMRRR